MHPEMIIRLTYPRSGFWAERTVEGFGHSRFGHSNVLSLRHYSEFCCCTRTNRPHCLPDRLKTPDKNRNAHVGRLEEKRTVKNYSDKVLEGKRRVGRLRKVGRRALTSFNEQITGLRSEKKKSFIFLSDFC